MLGYAIAERLFAKQNFWLGGQSLARHFRICENKNSGLFFKSVYKSPETLNCRYDYGAIVREGGSKRCALQRSVLSFNNNAVRIQIRNSSTEIKPYDIETNLKKDVILYRYENPKYFKRLNIFGFIQLLFWTYLAQFVFTELKDVPVTEMQTDDLPWWRRINFGEKTHRTILTFLTFFVASSGFSLYFTIFKCVICRCPYVKCGENPLDAGIVFQFTLIRYSLFSLVWLHTLKSVRYLVLRKGGNEVTFVTYTPFGENRLRTVPLDKMTSKQSREAAKVQLPIKVKGDFMHYLLDMRGEFRHPRLFDFTAGLKRPI